MKKRMVLKEEDSKELIDKWFSDAKKCANTGELSQFVGHLLTDYEHDYGTICHAITAAGIAAMHCVDASPMGGITGFQAGCIFWEFTKRWGVFDDGPKEMVQYKNMLYPQYEDKFDKTISPETWKWLRNKAKEELAAAEHFHPDVRSHMQSVADGKLPFGYQLAPE